MYCSPDTSLIFCLMSFFISLIFPIRFHSLLCYSLFLYYNFIFCLHFFIYSFLVNFHRRFIFLSIESSFPAFCLWCLVLNLIIYDLYSCISLFFYLNFCPYFYSHLVLFFRSKILSTVPPQFKAIKKNLKKHYCFLTGRVSNKIRLNSYQSEMELHLILITEFLTYKRCYIRQFRYRTVKPTVPS